MTKVGNFLNFFIAANARLGKEVSHVKEQGGNLPKLMRFNFWILFILDYYLLSFFKIPLSQKYYSKISRNQNTLFEKGKTHQVKSVYFEDLTINDFQELFLKKGEPILIKGMGNQISAVRNWSLDWFKENFPKEVIPVRPYASGLDEKSQAFTEMPLENLVTNIQNDGEYMAAHIEDIFVKNKDLKEQLNLNILQRYLCLHKRMSIFTTQMFMSGKKGKTGFHCAGGENLFIQVEGSKKWQFIHPKHSVMMKPLVRENFLYAASDVPYEDSEEAIVESGHELFPFIDKYSVETTEGDVLYVPQWWWHAVNNNGPTIGIATHALNDPLKGNKLFSLLSTFSPRSWKSQIGFFLNGYGQDKNAAYSFYKKLDSQPLKTNDVGTTKDKDE